MKNNKGMTLVELLVVIAIIGVITSLVYGMYISNTKAMSKTEIKNKLQTEGQYIQGTLSYIGMQSKGIKEIKADKITDSGEFNGYYEVKELDMIVLDKNNLEKYYRIKVENTTSKDNENKVMKIQELDESSKRVLRESILSDNVYTFKIKPTAMIENSESVIDSRAIDVYIDLYKKKGFSDVEYNISTLITFRNKKFN